MDIIDEFKQVIHFEPGSAERLSIKNMDKLSFAEIETLAYQLSLQLQVLEARGLTLLFWHPADITVFGQAADITAEDGSGEERTNKRFYVLTNLTYSVPLYAKEPNYLFLNYPITYWQRETIAPELLKISQLPFITHKSASYYSLGLMCLQLLSDCSSGGGGGGGAGLTLDDIPGTKLYYFLERCLKADPSERSGSWFV